MNDGINTAQRLKLCASFARKAAANSMVLMKNRDSLLPLGHDKPELAAVFGGGQIYTVKGGSGSGNVRNKHTVSIIEGLRNSGRIIPDETLAGLYEAWTREHPSDTVEENLRLKAMSNTEMIPENHVVQSAAERCGCAIIVISRIAGEGFDRKDIGGEYRLSGSEQILIDTVCRHFKSTVLVLNTCGAMDLSFADDRIKSILFMGLAGQEAGNALADVLTGKVTPSGKLTSTWARYSDYPSCDHFGRYLTNGNVNTIQVGPIPPFTAEQYVVNYVDDIYVGYRYFSTFGAVPQYHFGYGLSYTKFEITGTSLNCLNGVCRISSTVKNTGDKFSGREVVQVYVGAPDGELDKPFMELRGFAKTRVIAPGESDTVHLEFEVASLASYSQERAAYILEKGFYYVRAGLSSIDTKIIGSLHTAQTIVTQKLKNLMGMPPEGFSAIKKPPLPLSKTELADRASARDAKITVNETDIKAYCAKYRPECPEDLPAKNRKAVTLSDVWRGLHTIEDLVSQMDTHELCEICCGVGIDSNSIPEGDYNGIVGNVFALRVPGASGATADLGGKYGIEDLILADGPAGFRLDIDVPEKAGHPAFEQVCTAYPGGMLLGSSWDMALLAEYGRVVGMEAKDLGVDVWLAPGVNIHRNPLCGRSYEYFSEDPLLSGKCGAAITKAFQADGSLAVSVKHFAGNSQEDERHNSTSNMTERAAREIYLKAFEISVKEGKPLTLMTSYNDINGVPSGESFALCTAIARDEWGFDGLIMTDWGGGLAEPALSIRGGNDLIEPGGKDVVEKLYSEITAGKPIRSRGYLHDEKTVTRAMLQQSAVRILKVVENVYKKSGRCFDRAFSPSP